ncbi:unnamed protein product [Toxocara canis]|uniref:GOLGA2L5 domain-containing protein n=1 Tax=Toxocara canis TaxID=6265 RepID=A0A183U6Q8_TOXCA|nr:unnamed protein product [Toxocara canis]
MRVSFPGSDSYPSCLHSTPNGVSNRTLLQVISRSHMPAIAEKPLAWTELEARFARAMRQNADLIEQNERLEHVILQLQSENDTIGEYVTIYHHQRKLIRDRMREKEEAVARLSLEKEQVQAG